MLAGLMALNAFAIDAMIPALPAIGDSLNVAQENHRQLVVVAYMMGFGSTQLVWGPLADRFGRKPVLAAYGLLMFVWSWVRLPETLHPEYRRSLAWRDMASAAWATIKDKQSRGYTLALAITFGGLTAYIASIQQIVFDAFHQPDAIGLAFAGVAAPMAVASWANSKVVGRYGLRFVGHGGMVAFALVTLVHALIGASGGETLAMFVIFQGMAMACFAFTSSNMGTLAMEHMGPIAGTASSVQGVVGTIGGAFIGLMIGQAFDGTAQPFLWGMAGCAAISLVIVLLTEPKRLFAGVDKEAQARAMEPCPPPDI